MCIRDRIAVFPKDESTKLLIRQAVSMLNTASETVEALRLKMDETASSLPEYPVVMAMNGVGSTPVSYTHLDVYKRQLSTLSMPLYNCRFYHISY